MKKVVWSGLLSAVLFVSGVAVAETDKPFEVYGNIGFPQVGIGAGYGINDQFTVRGDISTLGSISRDFDEGDVKYKAKLHNNKFNVFADYFPMSNGFRLTGGLGLGKTELKADGHSRVTGKQGFTIGDQRYTVNLDGEDSVGARVKYPTVSPYFGIGWGHNIKTTQSGSWGFTADLGVFVGSPKTTIHTSSSLNDKLVEVQAKLASAGADITDEQRKKAQAEIDKRIDIEKKKIDDRIGKYKIIPMISVGATYRF